jgi:hypothetical protein
MNIHSNLNIVRGRLPITILVLICVLECGAVVAPCATASRQRPCSDSPNPEAPLPAQTATHAARQVDEYLKSFENLILSPARIADQARTTGEVSIATHNARFDLLLRPHDLRAPGYRAHVMLDGGLARPLDPGPVRTYAGSVRGLEGSYARFTIDDQTVQGMIVTGDEAYYIEPLSNFLSAGGPTDFILYRASDVTPNTAPTCEATLAEAINDAAKTVADGPPPATAPTHLVVELATEADFEYVAAAGGAPEAINEILGIMNQVEGIYAAELGMTFLITYQRAWATQADPYEATAPGAILREFYSHWEANLAGVARDLSHMWTGKEMDGTTIGLAWQGVACTSPAESYAISQLWHADARIVLTAHELGHNLGARHTNESPGAEASSCRGTIMVTPIGIHLTFCQASRDQIAAHNAANASCLSQAAEGCYAVVPLDRWMGEYFDNASLQGGPLMLRDEGNGFLACDLAQETFGAACGFSSGPYSVRWRRAIELGSGTYRFALAGDGRIDLVIDGIPIPAVIDAATGSRTADVLLEAGSHLLECERSALDAPAVVGISWQQLHPAAPSDLEASRRKERRVRLNWTDNSDNEDGFVVSYSDGRGQWRDVATVGADTTSTEITGFTLRRKHVFAVRAFNEYGDSMHATLGPETRR